MRAMNQPALLRHLSMILCSVKPSLELSVIYQIYPRQSQQSQIQTQQRLFQTFLISTAFQTFSGTQHIFCRRFLLHLAGSVQHGENHFCHHCVFWENYLPKTASSQKKYLPKMQEIGICYINCESKKVRLKIVISIFVYS